jgi:hypothetical protein
MEDSRLLVVTVEDQENPTLVFVPESLWEEKLDRLASLPPVSRADARNFNDFLDNQVAIATFSALIGKDELVIHVPKRIAKSLSDAEILIGSRLPKILRVSTDENPEDDTSYQIYLDSNINGIRIVTPGSTERSSSARQGPVELSTIEIGPFKISNVRYLYFDGLRINPDLNKQIIKTINEKFP